MKTGNSSKSLDSASIPPTRGQTLLDRRHGDGGGGGGAAGLSPHADLKCERHRQANVVHSSQVVLRIFVPCPRTFPAVVPACMNMWQAGRCSMLHADADELLEDQLEEVFRKLRLADEEGSGYISRSDFAKAAAQLDFNCTAEDWAKVYDAWDPDSFELVDIDTLEDLMRPGGSEEFDTLLARIRSQTGDGTPDGDHDPALGCGNAGDGGLDASDAEYDDNKDAHEDSGAFTADTTEKVDIVGMAATQAALEGAPDGGADAGGTSPSESVSVEKILAEAEIAHEGAMPPTACDGANGATTAVAIEAGFLEARGKSDAGAVTGLTPCADGLADGMDCADLPANGGMDDSGMPPNNSMDTAGLPSDDARLISADARQQTGDEFDRSQHEHVLPREGSFIEVSGQVHASDATVSWLAASELAGLEAAYIPPIDHVSTISSADPLAPTVSQSASFVAAAARPGSEECRPTDKVLALASVDAGRDAQGLNDSAATRGAGDAAGGPGAAAITNGLTPNTEETKPKADAAKPKLADASRVGAPGGPKPPSRGEKPPSRGGGGVGPRGLRPKLAAGGGARAVAGTRALESKATDAKAAEARARPPSKPVESRPLRADTVKQGKCGQAEESLEALQSAEQVTGAAALRV
eukprot:5710158-Pleurochrysis_carterae.AAC.1